MRVSYVRQLRVGIRRLRSCWKFFGKWVALDPALPLDELRHYFALLGQTRDQDIVHLHIAPRLVKAGMRSEEHTSELQSLMRISYAVFCLKKKNTSSRH